MEEIEKFGNLVIEKLKASVHFGFQFPNYQITQLHNCKIH